MDFIKKKKKKKEKRKNWDEQIERSKYKTALQCSGPMECGKGCKYSDDGVGCWICKGKVKYEDKLLFWVDGDVHYAICQNCNDASAIGKDVVCTCGAKCKCKVKMTTGYRA